MNGLSFGFDSRQSLAKLNMSTKIRIELFRFFIMTKIG